MEGMGELSTKAAFFVVALPAVARASLRLCRLNKRCDLRQMADRLRSVERWDGSFLANPRYLDASVSRLVSLLPPRRFGPCIKRCLLLLDLWSRCGLEPRIHVGTRKLDGEHHFHAWVSVSGCDSQPPEYVEIWSY